MSVEIPSALIRRVQAKLRKNAGVPSSYDSTDPSLLSSLPTLEDAISDLDADDGRPHPRCGKCRRGAGLLRGPKSTVCVFCGHDRGRDGVDQSISFYSTAACKKLLESLHLDGSEVVNLNTESNDSNEGRDTQHDELVLSTVLDLELKWPPEKEDEDAVDRRFEKAHINAQDVNISGVYLDSFFSDSKCTPVSGGHSVTSEKLMPGKQATSTESHLSSGPENFGSFNDFQTSSMAVKSENSTDGGDFSESFASWDAGFQSASFFSDSKSTTVSGGPSVTSEELMPDKQTISTESNISSGPENFDSFNDFQTSSMAVKSENSKDDGDFSESFASWDAGFQSASSHAFEITKQNDDTDDSLDGSRESAGVLPDTSGAEGTSRDNISGVMPVGQHDSEFDGFLYSGSLSGELGGQKDPQEANARKLDPLFSKDSINDIDATKWNDNNDDSLADWQDYTSATEAHGVLPHAFGAGAEATLRDHDLGANTVGPQNTQFDSFAYLDSFSGVLGKNSSSYVNDIRLDASVSNSSKSSNIMNQNDGFIGSWEEFSGLNEVPKKLSNLSTQTIAKDTSYGDTLEMKSEDLGDIEFGDFLQSDMFSRVSHKEDPRKVNDDQLVTFVSTSSIKEPINTKTGDDTNDPFDAWQDFISSNNSQRRSATILEEPNMRVTSYKHLFGTKSFDLQDMEFGDLVHSGFLSGASGGKRSATEVNNMQDASISYRMNGTDEKVGIDSVIHGSAHVPDKNSYASKLESTNSKVA